MDSLSTRQWCARGSLALLTVAFVSCWRSPAGAACGWSCSPSRPSSSSWLRVLVPRATGGAALVGPGGGRRDPGRGADPVRRQGLLWVAVVAAALLIAGSLPAASRWPPSGQAGPFRLSRRPGAAAAVPDHEPALGRRQGRPLRPQGASAEALGAEVVLLDGRAVDVAAARPRGPRRGADLLGVAGGDGTQALVAEVAAEHDVPLLVISAGTRNHFALDLGLDREDPPRCLEALATGWRLRIDLGDIGGPAVRQQRLLRRLRRRSCRAPPTGTTSAARRWRPCPTS